jgi:ribonuclease P protein component
VPLTSIVETLSPFLLNEGVLANATLETRRDSAMPPKKAEFPRSARLLRHADFERVYKQGRRHFSASMTVFYWPRPEAGGEAGASKRAGVPAPHGPAPHGLRMGFTVGRALGGAVQRNRMKRRLREAVRMTNPPAGVAADVVINPKKTLLTADFAVVVNEVSRAFAIIEQKLSGRTAAEAGKVSGSPRPEAGSRS